MLQGDDPKQFLNQYIGVENNIEILEEVSSGLGSMSIGNNDAVVRTIPTFELVGDQLVPSFPLEVLGWPWAPAHIRLNLQTHPVSKLLVKQPASIT